MPKLSKFIRITFYSILFAIVISLPGTGCGKKESTELFHRFPEKVWERFNILRFEIPVKNIDTYNIYLLARFSPDFKYETLDFNMIMNTPAGEERIHEYQMQVRSKSGGFCMECAKDSCEGIILLKKEIKIAKPGILKIEIENLTPRLTTEGILGVGIRMVRTGK